MIDILKCKVLAGLLRISVVEIGTKRLKWSGMEKFSESFIGILVKLDEWIHNSKESKQMKPAVIAWSTLHICTGKESRKKTKKSGLLPNRGGGGWGSRRVVKSKTSILEKLFFQRALSM